MSHALQCQRCGYIETAHQFPKEYPGACHKFLAEGVVEFPIEARMGNGRNVKRMKRAEVVQLAAVRAVMARRARRRSVAE